MAKIGVILCGSGHRDGSEIHEAVITMLTLEQAGAEIQCISLDKNQTKVMNHLDGTPLQEQRNMLIESARLARGKIMDIKNANPEQLDAVVLPGGFGAILNLCTFAEKGTQMTVDDNLKEFLLKIHRAKKPIGAICIAPVILAKIFGELKPELTLGNEEVVAAQVTQMGAKHINCPPTECIVDRKNLFITTPAYMLAKNIDELYQGIGKLSREIIRLSK